MFTLVYNIIPHLAPCPSSVTPATLHFLVPLKCDMTLTPTLGPRTCHSHFGKCLFDAWCDLLQEAISDFPIILGSGWEPQPSGPPCPAPTAGPSVSSLVVERDQWDVLTQVGGNWYVGEGAGGTF